jgi:BON domain
MKVFKVLSLQNVCRAAVLVAATVGLTATAMAQDADPAAQNSAVANAPAAPASNVISDAQVEANVLSALAGAPTLADQPISTTTTYGTVTLTGTVKDDASKKLAAQLASTSPGVKKVVDALQVGDIGATAAQAPEGAAPLPNNAPAPAPVENQNDQSAQQAPVSNGSNGYGQPDQNSGAPAQSQQQDQTYPPQQAGQPQGQYPAPQQGGYRNRNCPPLFTPDGRPYPPPPGCEPEAGGQYPGQVGGQQVTVGPGAFIQIRVSQGMDGKHSQVGTAFTGILMNDVIAGGSIALPRGAEVTGTVVDAKAAGGLTGSGALALQLTGISFGGQQYPLQSAVWGVNGPSKTGQTVSNAVGLGLFGAIVGAAVGGGPGAAVGAVAGGTAGVAASAATPGAQAFVPPEALLNFTLDKPVTVTTVSQAELNRLAVGAPGGPGYPPQAYRRRYYRPYYPYPY